jgi:LemA protein
MQPVIIAILAVLMVGAISLIFLYNALVRGRQMATNAWSQIDVQLQRRHDLVPNLVETVKGYMKHEQETLDKVIQARAAAINARTVPEKAQAESMLGQAITGLFGVVEAYPDLKADSVMRELQEELSTTENKISYSRLYYNDVTTRYNTMLETIPTAFMAGIGGFKPRDLFEIEDPAVREAPKVAF